MVLAREATARAVSLDPNNALGLYLSAIVKIVYGHDPAGAAIDIEAAHRADPALTVPGDLMAFSGCLSGICRDEYLRRISRDIDQDPLNPLHLDDRGYERFITGDLDGAESDYRHLLDLAPTYESARYTLASILIVKGLAAEAYTLAAAEPGHYYRRAALAFSLAALNRRAEAEEQLKGLLDNDAQDACKEIAEVYAALGEKTAALDWLEKDYNDFHVGVLYLGSNPRLRSLVREPRFAALMAKSGYPLKVAAAN